MGTPRRHTRLSMPRQGHHRQLKMLFGNSPGELLESPGLNHQEALSREGLPGSARRCGPQPYRGFASLPEKRRTPLQDEESRPAGSRRLRRQGWSRKDHAGTTSTGDSLVALPRPPTPCHSYQGLSKPSLVRHWSVPAREMPPHLPHFTFIL